ncbi:putative zn 2cys6 transcription factor protein [Botrytis fragariae]|uniref:Putative zn 2cys6 transcription factor protein n=1 Tax=Botrytis fragariae TaxID=1964551 RepID=A0A8H6ASE0_9HELO|nr:putative zn 2cys6 transcription factor protein [Botrytis fragariae]KAF5872772.1 putative zn 2cys6 transcription factor protein [Botrytis fragariae]
MTDTISSTTNIPHGNSSKPARKKYERTKERSKVTQACDQCRKGKARCSGNLPCTNCVYDKKDCSYNHAYARGRRTKILPNPNYRPDPQHKVFVGGSNLATSEPPMEREDEQMSPVVGSLGENLNFNQMMPQPQQSASNSPVANLVQQAQQMFDPNAPVSVLTYGDLPIPISQPGLLTLPSPDDGAKLVQIYFDKFSPSILYFHRPSVERWTDELLEAGSNLLQLDYLKSRNAIVFMIFASAQTYRAKSESLDISMLHYQLADEQLQSETARLLQCYYLAARGRINQCWTTFSNVVSLIFTLGLNRYYSKRGIVDLIEVECQKRVFWAAFFLDKFLSYALDRPQRLKIDDIDQELPKIINDRQFTPNNLIPASPDDLSTNLASNLQFELSIIASNILDQFYGFRKYEPEERFDLVQSYLTGSFPAWKDKAASLIQALPENLDEGQNRQRSELWLSYHHTKILLLRTYLLDPNCDVAKDAMIGKLTNACKYICDMVQPRPKGFVKESEETLLKHEFPLYADFVKSVAFRSAWFPQYIIFTAATVTYITGIKTIAQICKPDNEIKRKIEILHAPLKKIAFPGSFMGLCVSVLDELKVAVEGTIWRRFSMLDGEEYEDGETAEERRDLGRYLVMAREKLEESGEDWNEDLGAGRDPSHVMSRFRSWGFARLTNRMMERGL